MGHSAWPPEQHCRGLPAPAGESRDCSLRCGHRGRSQVLAQRDGDGVRQCRPSPAAPALLQPGTRCRHSLPALPGAPQLLSPSLQLAASRGGRGAGLSHVAGPLLAAAAGAWRGAAARQVMLELSA